MHERIRDKLLGAWGRSVASHPLITLALFVPLAVVCVLVTATGLEFRADRSELIDPGASWNVRYNEYKKNFPRANEDLYVVIDGDASDRSVDELARSIANRLRADPRVDSSDAGFDVAQASPRFFRLAPREQFDETLMQLEAARAIAEAPDPNSALATLLAHLNRAAPSAHVEDAWAVDRLEELLDPYVAAANGGVPDFSFLDPSRPRWQRLASQDGAGRLRYVRVHLVKEEGNGVDQLGPTLSWLRETVGDVVNAAGSDAEWGVTGIPAIESDETTEAIRDSTIASILAFALITLVMTIAFRGIRVPFLAAAALLVGMAWSFGWLMLIVGHLQLLSVVFSVILLGLGIDFALLYVSRLELIQDEHRNLASATARVYRRMGPGMVTGAVTTASAFAAIAFTKFKGMAEMGIIAAGGILLCLIAVLSVFPALLALTGKWKEIIRHRPGGETAHFAHGRLDVVDDHPRATLAVSALAVATLVWLALRVEYDPNVLNLQSPGVESVRWEHRVVEEDAHSVWYAVVVTEPHEARGLAARLLEVPEVSKLDGMARLFPADLEERNAAIAALRNAEIEPVTVPPGPAGMLQQLAGLQQGLAAFAAGPFAPGPLRERLSRMATRIADARATAGTLAGAELDAAWARLDAGFGDVRDRLAFWLDQALSPAPLGAEDLPPLLRDLWVGTDGSWLLQIHPTVDDEGRSILDPERLGPFVLAIRGALDDETAVIGPPVQIYESSELIKKEYIKAAVFALTAILFLLVLDFRGLTDAVCAMLPVSVGFVGAFGLMGLFGVPLNFANIIILPIIFGIGVNAGVHVVHRWRLEPFGRPRGLSGGTGRGITLTMITTIIGFGCLLVAEHRGIESLGFVMVIGLGVTLLACYTVLPAVLRLRTHVPPTPEMALPRRIARAAAAAKPRRHATVRR